MTSILKMAAPLGGTAKEFTVETARIFMVSNGGKVTNKQLVNYFKPFLINPDTKDLASKEFKSFVQTLATIKTENGEKYLALKPQFIDRPAVPPPPPSIGSHGIPPGIDTAFWNFEKISPSKDSLLRSLSSSNIPGSQPSPNTLSPLQPIIAQDVYADNYTSLSRQSIGESSGYSCRTESIPALVRSLSLCSSVHEPEDLGIPVAPGSMLSNDIAGEMPPPVPPRKKTSKVNLAEKENLPQSSESSPSASENVSTHGSTDDLHVSVRERTRKFDRMVSESELAMKSSTPPKKNTESNTDKNEDDDALSITSTYDSLTKEWFIKACRGDYHTICRMLKDHPYLADRKCFITGYTALHWAAKHGNVELVKVLAGTYSSDVNAKSHGGYTPLHIAAQFGNQETFDLLKQTYGAEINIRDNSGKKPMQYVTTQGTVIPTESIRNFTKRKRREKHDRDSRFLRIGSLNVRVKKTTEVFNNLIASSLSSSGLNIHKTWGSADNIEALMDAKKMPPPKFAPIKKRKSKKEKDYGSMPSLVAPRTLKPSSSTGNIEHRREDSDSDSACGFGAEWHA